MGNNNQEQRGFAYTYSAKEQAELKRIRDKYTPPTETEDKMARLRRLDESVTHKAQAASLILGVVGALILGMGLSLCMSDLAGILGLPGDLAMVIGIPVGMIGGISVALAYPMYNYVENREKKKIASEIIRLTDELMK